MLFIEKRRLGDAAIWAIHMDAPDFLYLERLHSQFASDWAAPANFRDPSSGLR